MGDVRRETVIENQSSGTTAGTTQVGVIETVEAVGLKDFRELLVYWEVTQGMVGTTPELRLLLQRAVVARPDPDNDDHWDDFIMFNEITTTTRRQATRVPIPTVMFDIKDTATWTADTGTLADFEVRPGHYGDRLRVLEVISGSSITQPAIYSLHLTGMC